MTTPMNASSFTSSPLQHQHDIADNIMAVAVEKLGNRTAAYGKKADKIDLLLKLTASKLVVTTWMKDNPDFVADATNLLSLNKKQLSKFSKQELALHYFRVGETLYGFSKQKRLNLTNELHLARTNITSIMDHISQVIEEAEDEINSDLDKCKVKLTPTEARRMFLQGGGCRPNDEAYETCAFCNHNYVDEVPSNKHVVSCNKVLRDEYNAKLIEFESNGSFITRDGSVSLRLPTVPPYKDRIYQCHCHQQSCINTATGKGCADCEKNGTSVVDSNGICQCRICKCTCRVAYKEGAYSSITRRTMFNNDDTEFDNATANAAPSQAFAGIMKTSMTSALAGMHTAIATRGTGMQSSDMVTFADTFTTNIARGIATDTTSNYDALRDIFGTGTGMAIGGAVLDANSLRDSGGKRAQNNRLNRSVVRPGAPTKNRKVVLAKGVNTSSLFPGTGRPLSSSSMVLPSLSSSSSPIAPSSSVAASLLPVTGGNTCTIRSTVAAAAGGSCDGGGTSVIGSTVGKRKRSKNGRRNVCHNKPADLLGFGAYVHANSVWNGIQSTAGSSMSVRVPSSKFKDYTEGERQKSKKKETIINIDDDNDDEVVVVGDTTREYIHIDTSSVSSNSNSNSSNNIRSKSGSPAATLASGLVASLIENCNPRALQYHTAADTPKEDLQHYYKFNKDYDTSFTRDVAITVIDSNSNATPSDLYRALNVFSSFPSTTKQRGTPVRSSKKDKNNANLKFGGQYF